MAKRYDWGAIRDEWVAGSDEITHRTLGDKYGVAVATIGRRASSENWTDQRSSYRHQVVIKTRDRASTKEAEVRVRHIGIAKLLMIPAIEKLKTLEPGDLSNIELLRFLNSATEIERKAAGIPEAHEIEGIVQVKLSNEVEAFIEDLESKLPPEVMEKVLDALSNQPSAAGSE